MILIKNILTLFIIMKLSGIKICNILFLIQGRKFVRKRVYIGKIIDSLRLGIFFKIFLFLRN